MSKILCRTELELSEIYVAVCLPTARYLDHNQISNDGVAALASALRSGALPSCMGISLVGNPGSGAPVREALASPERAAALARRQAE